MSAVIFSGPKVKTLKAGLQLKDEAAIYSGSLDPASAGFTANIGDLYISTSTGRLYSKIAAGDTAWSESGKVLGLTEDSIPFVDSNGSLTEDVQFTYDSGTQTLTVQNLTVSGTTTTVNTATLDVTDANITINNGGSNASAEGAGLTIDRTGTSGSLVYEDALASKFKLGAAGSELEVVTVSSAQTLTNKTINASSNTISNIGDSELTTGIDAAKLSTGVVSNTEFDYLNGVTSSIQTQLGGKEPTLTKGDLTEATSSVLTITGGTGAVIGAGASIEVDQASGAQDGYLSSTDWTTFNNKLDASDITGKADTDLQNIAPSGDVDMNTQKIVNVVDPTADQDAATKKYVDDNAVDISGKANAALDNLALVAINTSLLSDTDVTDDLGSAALRWKSTHTRELEVQQIENTAGALSYDVDNGVIYGGGATSAVNLTSRLLTSGAVTKLDWSGTDLSVNTRKITSLSDPTADQDAATKKYVDDQTSTVGNPNDIGETEVALADNQAAPATAIDLSATSLRGFELLVTVERDTTFQVKKLLGVKKNADWDINEENIGDDTGVVLTITTGGVIQYTSTSTGTAPTIKYRLKGIGVV